MEKEIAALTALFKQKLDELAARERRLTELFYSTVKSLTTVTFVIACAQLHSCSRPQACRRGSSHSSLDAGRLFFKGGHLGGLLQIVNPDLARYVTLSQLWSGTSCEVGMPSKWQEMQWLQRSWAFCGVLPEEGEIAAWL